MALATRRWDASETLRTKDDIAAYLNASLEDGDPALLKAALGDIARSKCAAEIAEASGLGPATLHKALSPGGIQEFAAVVKVLNALGLRFSVSV